MCGRFFWDNDAEEAFEEDFPELMRIARAQEKILRAGDYMPSMNAAAVVGGDNLSTEILKWGFPGFDKGELLINARAESVQTRPTFRDSFMLRRCVLPAAGFYEWDKKKNKVTFRRGDRPILYLAGIYRPYTADNRGNRASETDVESRVENRFVVLTREANASMLPVHDRMPLIINKDEVDLWIRDVDAAGSILTKELPQLVAERPYEQMRFEW